MAWSLVLKLRGCCLFHQGHVHLYYCTHGVGAMKNEVGGDEIRNLTISTLPHLDVSAGLGVSPSADGRFTF